MSVPQPATLSVRKVLRWVLLLVLPLLAAVAGAYIYLQGGRYMATDNAYVKGDKVPVSAQVSGTVVSVMVQDNQAVAKDQVLFVLDTAPFQHNLARAQARLSQVRTDLMALKASYREKQAEITLSRTKHRFAQREQQRQADLLDKQFISAAKFDDAKQNTDLAEQQTQALEMDLKRIAEALGGSLDTAIESHPSYRLAMAELAQTQLDLQRTTVRSAQAGVVSRPPKPGQFVGAGTVAMALVVTDHWWIEANFTETELTFIQPGQRATVRIDTYPDVQWEARVESLSPATGAEFSLIPAQNATGNWIKVTQRIAVRLALQPTNTAPVLRSGMSAHVEIDTEHRRRLWGHALP